MRTRDPRPQRIIFRVPRRRVAAKFLPDEIAAKHHGAVDERIVEAQVPADTFRRPRPPQPKGLAPLDIGLHRFRADEHVAGMRAQKIHLLLQALRVAHVVVILPGDPRAASQFQPAIQRRHQPEVLRTRHHAQPRVAHGA